MTFKCCLQLSYIRHVVLFVSVATRPHKDKTNEGNNSVDSLDHSTVVIRQFRCTGCGRLRSRCASRPVRRLSSERRGCRAGPGGGCARGLRAGTALAPPPASLLGLVTSRIVASVLWPSALRTAGILSSAASPRSCEHIRLSGEEPAPRLRSLAAATAPRSDIDGSLPPRLSAVQKAYVT